MQFDLSQPKNRIKILIIFVFVILSVVLLTFLFTRKPITLVSSDTVLTNVQYPITSHDQYYNTDALYFFTGTNVARVDTSTLSNDASESILEEYAYVNPELARFNNKTSTLLVRVDPGYLSYMPELNTKSQNSEQLTAWVLQSKKISPKLLSFDQPIIDANFVGEDIAVLTYTEKANQLSIFNPENNSLSTVLSSTTANKIIGIYEDTIYLRSGNGNVQMVEKSNNKPSVIKAKGSVVVDQKTGLLISGSDTEIKINKGTAQSSLSLETPHYYVADGFIIELDSKTRPTKLRGYNLETKQWEFSYNIDNSRLNNKENINSVHIVKTKPLTLLFIAGDNTVFTMSTDSKFVESIPVFKFPEQKTVERSGFVYDYNIGTNTAIIISNKPIKETLPLIGDLCSCNINSIQKDWRRDSGNGGQSEEDELIGDGAPPEELNQ